jgi:hypothetical protein
MKTKANNGELGIKRDSEDAKNIIPVIPLYPMNHIQRCGLTVMLPTTFLGQWVI